MGIGWALKRLNSDDWGIGGADFLSLKSITRFSVWKLNSINIDFINDEQKDCFTIESNSAAGCGLLGGRRQGKLRHPPGFKLARFLLAVSL